MKIVCPTCEATYEVPEAVLTSRRAVRCARCNNDWVPGDAWYPAMPEPEPEPQAVTQMLEPPGGRVAPAGFDDDLAVDEAPEDVAAAAVPAPPPPDGVPPAAARLRQSAASAFAEPEPGAVPHVADGASTRQPMPAWIASIAALLALGVLAVLLRDQVMHFWPASERIYAGLGLAPR